VRTVSTPSHRETLLEAHDNQWIGSIHEEYDAIDSTQKRAIELLRNGHYGAVVTALHQSAGVGRMGKTFWSPDSTGLYVSLTLPLPNPIERFPLLSLWAGVTVVRAIREAGVILSPVPINLTRRLSLKWPNDVLLDGKKLAGILVNSVVIGAKPLGAVLGIGVNLNMEKKDFPADIRNIATSIKAATGNEWDRQLFQTHLLSVIERMWRQITETNDSILSEWLRWGPDIGQPITLHDDNETYEGKFAGLTHEGELVLSLADGNKKSFLSGLIESYNVE